MESALLAAVQLACVVLCVPKRRPAFSALRLDRCTRSHSPHRAALGQHGRTMCASGQRCAGHAVSARSAAGFTVCTVCRD